MLVEKKFGTKILVENIFFRKTFLGNKFFWVGGGIGRWSIKILVKKYLGRKKFWVKKNLVEKTFG